MGVGRRGSVALLLVGVLASVSGATILFTNISAEVAPNIWIDGQAAGFGHNVILREPQIVESDSFGISVYIRDTSGGFVLQQFIPVQNFGQNVSYLAIQDDQVAAVDRSGQVEVYRLTAHGLDDLAGFSMAGGLAEFWTASWNGDYLAAGGFVFGQSTGVLRIAHVPALQLEQVWSFNVSEPVEGLSAYGNGFVAAGGALYRVDMNGGVPGYTQVGAFRGAKNVAVAPMGNAVASLAQGTWSIIETAPDWSAPSTIPLAGVDSTIPGVYVRDVRFFSGAIWVAADRAGLFRVDATQRVQRVMTDKEDVSALGLDGSRLAVAIFARGTYILREGDSTVTVLSIATIASGGVLATSAVVVWRRNRGGGKHDQERSPGRIP